MRRSAPQVGIREIREIRQKLRLSQPWFAAVLGVSAETYRTWDSGRRAVPEVRASSPIVSGRPWKAILETIAAVSDAPAGKLALQWVADVVVRSIDESAFANDSMRETVSDSPLTSPVSLTF